MANWLSSAPSRARRERGARDARTSLGAPQLLEELPLSCRIRGGSREADTRREQVFRTKPASMLHVCTLLIKPAATSVVDNAISNTTGRGSAARCESSTSHANRP